MPYARNPVDGMRTYFEDPGGPAPPVLFYSGFPDSVEYSKTIPLARALSDEFRLLYADHRGMGRSDKPHDVSDYSLVTRVADAVAVLDAAHVERAHYVGVSWGARLGFAVGEHAPDRVMSLVLCGNQPYAWDPSWPMYGTIVRAMESLERGGMQAFVEAWEAGIGERFPEPARTMMLDNDPAALNAAFRSVAGEGAISPDLGRWRVPCLIYVGSGDDMHPNAERAAAEIPGARFLSLAGHTHLSVEQVAEELMPHVRELFASAAAR